MNGHQTLKSGFKTPITINDAIINIERRTFLLPALQRKFVWSSDQIEVLFDSIMRDYPINSFMFWSVTSGDVKNSFRFYEFLKEYRYFFNDENPYINTRGYNDFTAVIDGQQRLTSLYIGLKGSYAYKMPRKWLRNDEESLPTRQLYLNLNGPLPQSDERKMVYDFKFLSKKDYERLIVSQDLFLVGDIYDYKDQDDLEDYMAGRIWKDKIFAKGALRKLREVVFKDPLINYYQEENQDLDTVLDIFIRTNSGGEPLSYSNLLMSIMTANWKRNARQEFKDLIDAIYANDFIVSADLILKCCLVLFNDDIKFQVANFSESSVRVFEENWDKIRKSILVTFELLRKWGFNDASLRAKNAVIPIVFFIYHNNIQDEILKDVRYPEAKKDIRKWLSISLLKGIFGGQSDSVLIGIRSVLRETMGDGNRFPFEEIKKKFASNDAKSLSLNSEAIEDILYTQKDAPDCYAILSLLYSHLQFDTIAYHKDHLHPASAFGKLTEKDFVSVEDFEFYTDKKNWNSILNLQLLSRSVNVSKNDESLQDWVTNKNIDLPYHLIPAGVGLEFSNFREFINKRKDLLTETLNQIVNS
ncbi:DUF262 domain-containing protein [uncultured Porphyromonas sp.]|uniref:DUF262 domain-containing protein n=1 Tax=uncultured Porphyromonas sp. TaxID=159274 RepID=UPI0026235225|nr:DUF262 domain-containing protein [uncultured Porphyromonas sp.]